MWWFEELLLSLDGYKPRVGPRIVSSCDSSTTLRTMHSAQNIQMVFLSNHQTRWLQHVVNEDVIGLSTWMTLFMIKIMVVPIGFVFRTSLFKLLIGE